MESAHSVRRRITNGEIYALIEREPGLSKYELGKELNWTPGKTDGAIKRLLKEERIFIKEIQREGKRVGLIYPAHMRPDEDVSIPLEELEINNPIWMDTAFMYALNMYTIGVTGNLFDQWDDISLFTREISIRKDNDEIRFKFPEEFKRFYELNHKHYNISINGNKVLLIVSGNIVG